MPTQTIELDCRPGHPRPADLIPQVIAGTALPAREPISKLFGNWTWDYSDIPQEIWASTSPIIKKRIKSLYAEGLIRYGSW